MSTGPGEAIVGLGEVSATGRHARVRAAATDWVRLREATADDRDAILDLPGLGASTRSLLDLDLAGTRTRLAVVAVDAVETVVGFAITTRQPDEVHLLDVAVAVALRRSGIARRLLAWLAAAAMADGATAMTLEVRTSNGGARRLYDQLGFTSSGVRPGYYTDGEDAVIMWHRDLTGMVVRADPSAMTRTR